jgi:uncharacterized OB-fold protein
MEVGDTWACSLKIGTKVQMVFRKIVNDSGLDFYGYKFRLVEEA